MSVYHYGDERRIYNVLCISIHAIPYTVFLLILVYLLMVIEVSISKKNCRCFEKAAFALAYIACIGSAS